VLTLTNNVNLHTLYAADNRLTSLNLATNTELVTLWFPNNSISSINLSNNRRLRSLDASRNSLTSLDLTNNVDLTDLFVNQNRLTSLDVTKNPLLDRLDVRNNDLPPNVDIRNNPLLRSVDFRANSRLNNILVWGSFCLGTVLNEDRFAKDVNARWIGCAPNIISHPPSILPTQSVAAGATYGITVAASSLNDGTLSYQWYRNTTASNSGGTPISGATSPTYNAPLDEAGTFFFYIVVTNNTPFDTIIGEPARITGDPITLNVR
jgi:hypothetical protein